MNRHASVVLRRLVDEAVGPAYDPLFLQLDLLLTGREGRCGCVPCRGHTADRCAELLRSLPPV